MSRSEEDVAAEMLAAAQAKAVEMRRGHGRGAAAAGAAGATPTAPYAPMLATSGEGGVNMQFRPSMPSDAFGPVFGDSVVYDDANQRAASRRSPSALRHTAHSELDELGAPRHLVTSQDSLNLKFGSSPQHDPRGGPAVTYEPHGPTSDDVSATPAAGPQLRYSTVGELGAPPRVTSATPPSRYMKAGAPARQHPHRRSGASRASGAGSSIHAGRFYSAPDYYSAASNRSRQQTGGRAGPASAAFDSACASACAAVAPASSAAGVGGSRPKSPASGLNHRGAPRLGYVSPQPGMPFGRSDPMADPNTRPPGACGGPSAGPYGSQRNEHALLQQMAHAAAEAHAEAARTQEAMRQQARVAAEAQRNAVARHVEAQQIAVATAAGGELDGWIEPPGYEPIAGGTHAPPSLLGRVNASEGELDVAGEMQRLAASMACTQPSLSAEGIGSDGPRPPAWSATPGGGSSTPLPPGGATPGAAVAPSPSLSYISHPGPSSTAAGVGPSGLRAIQLITTPHPVPPPPPASSLRRSLDVALYDSSRAREECVGAQQEVMDELGRTVWPNQTSGLAARALVVRLSRSAARLRAACERLEKEADVAHHAHKAELEAAFHRCTRRPAPVCVVPPPPLPSLHYTTHTRKKSPAVCCAAICLYRGQMAFPLCVAL